MPSADAQGVEPLEGESEAEYVARQTRLREEAAERMRAKFGKSGGLNGGVSMGGIGSSPAGGGGGYGFGESLSSIGSNASWLLGKAADAAGDLKESAKSAAASARERVQERTNSSSSIGSYGGYGGGDGPPGAMREGSTDLSDLLGGCDLDAARTQPGRSPAAKVGSGRAVADDWGDDGWGASPVAKAAPPPAAPVVTAVAPVAPATPVSVHFGGANGATPNKKKVAAAK
jgi:hypothetical protein